MHNMDSIIRSIKRAAIEAVQANDPMAVVYGTVTADSPLTIMVEQKLPLTAAQLILTNQVQDYEIEVSIADGAKQKMKVYNGLKVGDKVFLLKEQGGQKYVVLDKEYAG